MTTSTPLPFPFNHVVITFPDQRAADAADAGPLQALRERMMHPHSTTSLHASTDPHGSRVGSGGGTLAALVGIIPIEEEDASSVLILHAGGESSRCPTQMVLGKAWTSIPCSRDNGVVSRLLTPVELWLEQCRDLFQGIPAGTVVVVASDTLLHLPPPRRGDGSLLFMTSLWGDVPETAVLGLAVPAPLQTAKNHGVFVLGGDHDDDDNSKQQSSMNIQPCLSVWQKPSLERLETVCFAAGNDNDKEPSAWIDTGVIVWMPAAAAALRRLATNELVLCTAQGLETAWKKAVATAAPDTTTSPSLSEYSRRAALKVDLYTHFLQALSLIKSSSADPDRRSAYCQRHTDLPASITAAIFDALSQFELKVWTCSEGQFLHLGTTRELQDWLIQGSGCKLSHGDGLAASSSNDTTNRRRELCLWMGRKLGLTRRLESLTVLGDAREAASNTVIYHSVLVGSASSSIGEGSVVEHSCYETVHPIQIGKRCLVSGLRHTSDATSPADQFCIPDGIMLQMLPMASKTGAYVYMVLGVDDNIKTQDTLYGRPLDVFLALNGLFKDDLWDADCSKRMVWNARIHPIATTQSFNTLFDWLHGADTDSGRSSLEAWKSCPRLSLAEIRDQSDAAHEFNFRQILAAGTIPRRKEQYFKDITSTVVGREHIPIDLQCVIDLYQANGEYRAVLEVLHALDSACFDGLDKVKYDVCGRACMVASAFLDELGTTASSEAIEPVPVADNFVALLSSDSSDAVLRLAMEKLVSTRDLGIVECPPHASLYARFSSVMERVAHTMTARCVCDPNRSPRMERMRQDPVQNRWIMATAPARIDLSGGWTDTPPICFEYGSSVTGVAVCVDKKKPLSCRCRIVPGGSGIHLKSELRDGTSGQLLTTMDVEVSSLEELKDYLDPRSDCALLKCAVMCLASDCMLYNADDRGLQSFVNALCGSNESVRLEVIVTSLLPHGSGLGTSSILGGCVLAAVGECIGMPFDSDSSTGDLIDAVLVLEQRLTTGGGFQDQVNGLVGGIKMVSSKPLVVPLGLSIERLPMDNIVRQHLNDSLVLAFTGKTRMAKNLLQSVLRHWAQRTPRIVETVQQLVQGAAKARDAVLQGDLDVLGECLTSYWHQKKVMAGASSGAEPAIVAQVITELRKQGLLRGASLCGAGGGGFMAVLTADGVSIETLKTSLQQGFPPGCRGELDGFTWHTCTICDDGLQVQRMPLSTEDADTFDLSWHAMDGCNANNM